MKRVLILAILALAAAGCGYETIEASAGETEATPDLTGVEIEVHQSPG